MIPYGIPFSKRFLLYSAALYTANPREDDDILVVTTVSIKSVSFCGFLPNAKELGHEISEWWSEKYDRFLWYQNCNNFEKNENRKD